MPVAGWRACTRWRAVNWQLDKPAQRYCNFQTARSSVHSVIRTTLKLMGLYWRGCKNAEQIQVRHNHISMKTLPSRFDGFTLLHISDLHVDMNEGAMRRLEIGRAHV